MREAASNLHFLQTVRTSALQHPALATDFETGKKKLIPVIFCHDVGMNRNHYQLLAQELASHGFIVFVPDFIDGTCTYTEMGEKDSKKPDLRNFNSFDTGSLLMDHLSNQKAKQEARTEWYQKQQRRLLELETLITDIQRAGFAKTVLKLGNTPLIDSKKLIVVGHRMGGATALLLGDKDKRVSSVVAFDPWLDCMQQVMQPHWQLTQSLQKKPLCILWSEEYYKKAEINRKLEEIMSIKEESQMFENWVVKGSSKDDLTDFVQLMPIETYRDKNPLYRKSLLPSEKQTQIFQFFIYQMMRFLTKKTFYSLGATDPRIFDLLIKDYCDQNEAGVIVKAREFGKK